MPDRAPPVPTPDGSPPAPEPATGGADHAPAGVLVEDGATAGPGQMAKGAFLDQLEGALVPALTTALAGTDFTAQSCPVLGRWMAHYRGQSAADVERALQRYTGVGSGASAPVYLTAAVARVVAGTLAWRVTGRVDLPEGAPAGAAGDAPPPDAPPAVLGLRGDASAPSRGDPGAVRASLGAGRPLPGGVRTGLEAGFGADLGAVRLHTDAHAGQLARRESAHAFAVGDHVAFAPGMYQPGSLGGDLLLAHEVAHTLQQSGRLGTGVPRGVAGGALRGLEAGADVAAAQAVLRMREARGEAVDDTLLDAHAAALAELRFDGPASAGLRLQRCDSCTPTSTPAPPPKWWEQVSSPQAGTERDVYFRPVSHATKLRDLLRQVDMTVTYDDSKPVLKKAPGAKASEQYIPGKIAATQWTDPAVKKKVDAVLPTGAGTIVTQSHVGQIKTIVDDYRKAHPQAFSMLQGVQAVNCKETGACIGTMNKVVENLYGSTNLQTNELADTAFGSMDKLAARKMLAGDTTIAATYTGSGHGKDFVISEGTPPAEVTVSGAGKWVLDQADAGGAGVHVFLMSLMNGYHSVTLAVANEGTTPTTIVWKDHHGLQIFDAAGLDAKIARYAWGYYAWWLSKKYNQLYDPDVDDSSKIPADKLPEVRAGVETTVIADIKKTRIAHLGPQVKK